MSCAGLSCAGLSYSGLNYAGLGYAGLGGVVPFGLCCVALRWAVGLLNCAVSNCVLLS